MKQNDRIKNVFTQLRVFEETIEHLESKILQLENKLEEMIQIERNHLIRVKNHEHISDDFIQQGKCYQDIAPERAHKLYQDNNYNFILIDVSSNEYKPRHRLPEAIRMPWEDFQERFIEIQNHTTPIFIISEDGTNSILACEFLVKRGFFNCNNISGGYKFWKGNQLSSVEEQSA